MFFRGKQHGYTIAELMIVVAIIGLLAGLAVIFFRPGEDALALDRAAQKLAQDVRSVAQLALKAERYECGAGTATSAYGVVFDQSEKTSYKVFADCIGKGVYNPGNDDIVKTLQIEERNIEIWDVLPVSPQWIIFTPPDPEVTFESSPPITITLRSTTSPSHTRAIIIGAKGTVEVQ